MNLSIMPISVITHEPCAVCGQDHKPDKISCWIFKDADESKSVCIACAEKHTPQLYSLLNFIDQQQEYQNPSDQITAALEKFQEMANSLEQGDLEKLRCDLSGLCTYADQLFNFVQSCEDNLKESEAKRAIDSLMKEGFSFKEINLDGVGFSINDGQVERVTHEDEIPF